MNNVGDILMIEKIKHIDYASWGKFIIALLVVVVPIIYAYSQTTFQVERNSKDILSHKEWMIKQNEMQEKIEIIVHKIEINQATILEKLGNLKENVNDLKK